MSGEEIPYPIAGTLTYFQRLQLVLFSENQSWEYFCWRCLPTTGPSHRSCVWSWPEVVSIELAPSPLWVDQTPGRLWGLDYCGNHQLMSRVNSRVDSQVVVDYFLKATRSLLFSGLLNREKIFACSIRKVTRKSSLILQNAGRTYNFTHLQKINFPANNVSELH